MPTLISPTQSAFVPKRVIGDNIMLAQALCHDYHLNKDPPRCANKLDVHKAFDSLNWGFLFAALDVTGFPSLFINWIHTCVTTCMLSVKINGELEGFLEQNLGFDRGTPFHHFCLSFLWRCYLHVLLKLRIFQHSNIMPKQDQSSLLI